MNLNKKTLIRASGFIETFYTWPVNDEWKQELYNYIVLGYHPGSFHTSCFANDLLGAACSTHISNNWEDIAAMMKWINEYAPKGSWGTYNNVSDWLATTDKERYDICVEAGFILTDEEVTWKMLEEGV